MTISFITLIQSLNKAYRLIKPRREDLDEFKSNFLKLLSRIDENESEENVKGHLADFLKSTYYKDGHLIATKERADLVIHLDKDAKSPVGVLFEVKKPSNKGDMITKDNLNAKAMHELILYFLRERFNNKNISLTHLVITNIYEWFVFDASLFEKAFAQNSQLQKAYKEWEAGQKVSSKTDLFYKEIVKPFLHELDKEFSFTYVDIREYNKYLKSDKEKDDNRLIPLYKFFSPVNLLKLPFINDSNSLDAGFFKELLHIIGLEETKEGGKKIIRRLPEAKREPGSLLENAINILEVEGTIRKVSDKFLSGKNNEDQLFNLALELCITWVNRILFLKLLEAQLLKYHNGNSIFRFLNVETIRDYDELYKLFFQVLARQGNERTALIQQKYSHIPYLNSSLFEISALEDVSIKVNGLDDNLDIDLYSFSILNKRKMKGAKEVKSMNTLHYFFAFLDAYDFSSVGKEEIQEENKTIINAAVLGLVFEKINGYKDGSIYTPGAVTMFMCRETIRKAVVQKFNEIYEWQCEELEDVRNYISDKRNRKDILEFNKVIESIRIADPAVGSGHFLVSSLNELIAIKADLGILADQDGNRLNDIDISIANDELIITYHRTQTFFEYTVNVTTSGGYQIAPEIQTIQQTLFDEKRKIIEGSLFGVDINPNSVKICQLRLWIELLKHAYYKPNKEHAQLETLPNIDINIKQGNSLISRFKVQEEVFDKVPSFIRRLENYKSWVKKYKETDDKRYKEELKSNIELFISEFKKRDPRILKIEKQLTKRTEEYILKYKSNQLFENAESKKQKAEKQGLEKDIDKLKHDLEGVKNDAHYKNAFEWRFEFPEVLNEEGDFEGFEVVIGNPPYIQLQKMGEDADALQKAEFSTFIRTGDIYCLFYEQAIRLLKPNYYFGFITSNKWMRANYGVATRKFFLEKSNPRLLVDFGGFQVFDSATVDTNILISQKRAFNNEITTCLLDKSLGTLERIPEFIKHRSTKQVGFKSDTSWVILNPIEAAIKNKVEAVGTPLRDWDINIYRGVLTGFNEAFIIDGKKKDELISADPKSAEIIHPILRGRDIMRYSYYFSDLWLISIPWHFPLHNDPQIRGASFEAEMAFKSLYSAVYNHLLRYKHSLESRNKAETGIRYEWYAMQRFGANYWEDFFRPKIMWAETMRIHKQSSERFPRFSFDKERYITDKTCFFATGRKLEYILAILNSSLGRFMCSQYVSILDNGGYLMQKIFVELFPIRIANSAFEGVITTLCQNVLDMKQEGQDTSEIELKIDEKVFELYELDLDEILFITGQQTVPQ